MEHWLENKRIVVIGGTAGIGLSAVRSFVRHGAKVVVIGLGEENTAGEIESELDGAAMVMLGDAREENIASAAISLCRETFGGFDGLYHVAGGSGRKFGDGPLHELSKSAWEQTFDLNLTPLMLSNQAAVRAFMDQDTPGTILNLTSVLSYSPSPAYFTTHAYAAAKSAVLGFVKSIASFYAPNNIRVNALAPALVETPMSLRAAGNEEIRRFIATKQPLDGGRLGKPSDLDGAAVYFMSDASAYTTGQVLSIDGGWTISDGQL